MKKWKRYLGVGAMAAMTILLVLIIFVLLNGKQTYTSEGGEEAQSISSLVCTVGNQEDNFFYTKIANTAHSEIKATYKDKKLDKLFYTYKGVYRSNDVANEDETNFHSKYNIYMGENGIVQGDLNPSYSVSGTKFNLTLYIDDYDKLVNKVTAPFFFIDEDKIKEIGTYSIENMKKYYESKNFKCQIVE